MSKSKKNRNRRPSLVATPKAQASGFGNVAVNINTFHELCRRNGVTTLLITVSRDQEGDLSFGFSSNLSDVAFARDMLVDAAAEFALLDASGAIPALAVVR